MPRPLAVFSFPLFFTTKSGFPHTTTSNQTPALLSASPNLFRPPLISRPFVSIIMSAESWPPQLKFVHLHTLTDVASYSSSENGLHRVWDRCQIPTARKPRPNSAR